MYAFDFMIDLCNQRWRSPSHRDVAIKLLIGNGRIYTRQQLIDFGAKINALTKREVEALTIEGADKMGIPLN